MNKLLICLVTGRKGTDYLSLRNAFRKDFRGKAEKGEGFVLVIGVKTLTLPMDSKQKRT